HAAVLCLSYWRIRAALDALAGAVVAAFCHRADLFFVSADRAHDDCFFRVYVDLHGGLTLCARRANLSLRAHIGPDTAPADQMGWLWNRAAGLCRNGLANRCLVACASICACAGRSWARLDCGDLFGTHRVVGGAVCVAIVFHHCDSALSPF